MPKLKIAKWIIGTIALVLIFINLVSKAVQLYHLKQIDFNMISYSPIAITLIFISSILFLSLSFIDRIKNKNFYKNPEQIVVLVLGVSGLLYATLITYFKIRSMGWLPW